MKIEYLQIRSDSIVIYELPLVQPPREYKKIERKAYSGEMTPGAKRRLRKAIDILVQKTPWRMTYNPITYKTFPFRLNFVTLTFSCEKIIHGDEAHKNMIKPLLRKLRKKGDFSYIWKAEFQSDEDYKGYQKKYGGQLHYHFVTNTFIAWTELRREWNKLQRKNGYLKSYALKYGNYDPNSIDVHATYQVKNLSAYLSKYLSKKPGKKHVGKTWDCSIDLKKDRFSSELNYINNDAIKARIKNGSAKVKTLDHCVIIKMKDPQKVLSVCQYQAYQIWKA